MVSKKITLSILLLATVGSNYQTTALSDNAYAECYKGKDSEYRYLEFYFIEQPKNLLNEHVKKSRAITLTGITSLVLINDYFKKTVNKNVIYPIFNTHFDVTSIAAAILALTGFDTYTLFTETTIKKEALIKFVTNWEFHKQFIPTSLISAFDELATAFNASESKTFSDQDVTAIFEVIQHMIEHEFSKRYEKEKKKDTDTMNLFKTITDINKNLK